MGNRWYLDLLLAFVIYTAVIAAATVVFDHKKEGKCQTSTITHQSRWCH